METNENTLKDDSTLRLILLLLGSIIVWLVAAIFMAPVLWFLIILVLSIVYIVKNKNVEKKDVITGVAFGIISIPANPILGIIAIPAYIGAISVLKDANNKIKTYNEKNSILNTVLFIVVVGGILGGINMWFGTRSGITLNPSIKIIWFLRAFTAGITEEIIFRLFFFAVCIRTIKDKPLTKLQNIICYLIITIPHTLMHFDLSTLDLSSVVTLTVLFGLPFAIALRKRDLTSAIGTHMFVDLIRFVLTGV